MKLVLAAGSYEFMVLVSVHADSERDAIRSLQAVFGSADRIDLAPGITVDRDDVEWLSTALVVQCSCCEEEDETGCDQCGYRGYVVYRREL